jgi:eukaryotic-like serine/threonine-protein kinase
MPVEPQRWAAIESLYQEALEHDPVERSAWLQQACGDDADLLKEVESLLACADASLSNPAPRPEMGKLWDHIAGHSDIDSQALSDAAADNSGIASAAPGMRSALPSNIGPYRILRLLGEGGMGVVYEAEQEHPRRTVALKVIKSGLSDPKLVRRFEQELLALGRLQHPGIAQIYEAGTADNGFGPQPYFAMELVRGHALLEYADAHQLTTRQRLDLMARVCEAVHHAHQRGIIHRDLKPGNILVDETGQPKILDFGVARATDSDARMTHQTDLGQLVGTLAYMSPEQVLADPLELDIRSDVYALGVVLYQMLARRLPYKISPRLPEAVRTIQEDEPKPLSTVSSRYRGDIETIVGKALEKDKARRYSSAAELAADIRRYLHDEPIMARPASTIYHLQKFARRHKALVSGLAAVFVVLIAGIIVSTREAARANREAATSLAISDFLQNDLLAQASAANQARPNNKPDPDLKVRTALDRAAARIAGRFNRQPEVEAAIRNTMGQTYTDLGLYPEARTQLERALDLRRQVLGAKNPETLKTMERLGYVAFLQGKYPEAESVLGNTLEMQRRVFGSEYPDTLKSMDDLAVVYREQGKYPQAEALGAQVLDIRRRTLGPEHPDTLASMNSLAIVYRNQGKYEQAEALSSQTLGIRRRVLGPEHPDTLRSMNNLANVYINEDKYEQAEALYSQSLEIRRHVLGPDHPETLQSMVNLSIAYFAEGKFAQAEALDNQVVEIQRRVLGPEHPKTLSSMHSLATAFLAQGKYTQAESLDRQTLEIRRRILGPEHPDTLSSLDDLARVYAAQGEYTQAETLFRQVQETERRVLGSEHPDTLSTLSAMAKMYQQWGKYALAENYAAQALAGRRHALGSEDVYTMVSAEDLALAYQSQGKFAKAEPLAREALEFNQKEGPDDWDRFRAESLLGASLAGQKKYAEAEPLLLNGYKGMEAQQDQVLMPNWYNLDLTRDWLVQLYEGWGKPAKAAKWSKSLQAGNTSSTKK